MKHVLGRRGLSGILTFADGIPFCPALNFDNANTGTVSRPERGSHCTLSNTTISRYSDIDAFVFPARYTFGNSGRDMLDG